MLLFRIKNEEIILILKARILQKLVANSYLLKICYIKSKICHLVRKNKRDFIKYHIHLSIFKLKIFNFHELNYMFQQNVQ